MEEEIQEETKLFKNDKKLSVNMLGLEDTNTTVDINFRTISDVNTSKKNVPEKNSSSAIKMVYCCDAKNARLRNLLQTKIIWYFPATYK